ncbi:MAG: hypothetical protein ACE5LD_03790, partial [Candidatus Bipolaricaulia bacterium]
AGSAQIEIELPQKLTGERITLLYPLSLISRQDARVFLAEQEAALAWVEGRLGLEYEGRLEIRIESDWFSYFSATANRFANRIIYIYESYPLYRLNTLEKTPVHELVHVVTVKGWGLSAPFLMEGIAVAIDADYRGLLSPFLVSLGLLRRGDLPFLDIREKGFRWLDYYPAGSFTLSVLREHGLDRFGEFYRMVGKRFIQLWDWARRSYPRPEEFAQRAAKFEQQIEAGAEEIFGKGLNELRAAWESSLASPELEEQAEYALQALEGWDGAWKLRVQLGGLAQIGLLGPVPQKLGELRETMVAALRRLLNDLAPETAGEEFADFQVILQAYKLLLDHWWAAASSFMDVKGMIYYGTAGHDPILTELWRALALYSQVEDTAMVDKVERYIEAFELLREGERLIKGPQCERGLELLREAEALFRELGEPIMVLRVGELIRARPTCYQPA